MKQYTSKLLYLLVFFLPLAVILSLYWSLKLPLYALIDGTVANQFLSTIAGVLAGIVAIIFSFSVLAIQISSDRYTPRLFTLYIKDWFTGITFAAFLLSILIAVISIGIQTIPMYQWGFLIVSGLFSFCLTALLIYIQRTLRLLNPNNLARHIQQEAIQAANKKDAKLFSLAITLLGDIAVKAFERGEDQITQEYLYVLQEIQLTIVNKGKSPAFRTEKEFAVAMFGYGVPSSIVDQYHRVFTRALDSANDELTRSIAELLIQLILDNVDENGNDQVLTGFLTQQYPQFLKSSIAKQNTSRFLLCSRLKDALFSPSLLENTNTKYLTSCLNALYQANITIIEENDFKLWKAELGYLSDINSIEQQREALYIDYSEFLSKILNSSIPVNESQWNKWHRIGQIVSTRISEDEKQTFESNLAEITAMIPLEMLDLRTDAAKIRREVAILWVTRFIYDLFFRACVYALYLDRTLFIKELWQHVNPPDASAHYSNANMVSFDERFLIHQLVDSVTLPWEIEGYHGGGVYVQRYFLICLSYALQNTKDLKSPLEIESIDASIYGKGPYPTNFIKILKEKYFFLKNLPFHIDRTISQFASIIKSTESWGDVLDNDADAALTKAKDWIIDPNQKEEWEREANSILLSLPLEVALIDAYRQGALSFYEDNSQIKYLALIDPTETKNPKELKSSCRFQCPNKIDFTVIGYGPGGMGVRVGIEPIAQMIKDERKQILDTLVNNRQVKKIRIRELTYNKVLELVTSMEEQGYEPTVLLAYFGYFSLANQNDVDFRKNIIYEGNERFLKLGVSRKLRMIEIQEEGYAFIIDKRAGNWFPISTLEVYFEECERNPLLVKITAKQEVDYQVVHPTAATILKLRPINKKSFVE